MKGKRRLTITDKQFQLLHEAILEELVHLQDEVGRLLLGVENKIDRAIKTYTEEEVSQLLGENQEEEVIDKKSRLRQEMP